MSARRRAEPGSPHRGEIVGLADFAGTGGAGSDAGHGSQDGYDGNGRRGGNGHGANGYDGDANGYGGVQRAEQQPPSTEFRTVLGNFATGVTIITAVGSAGLEAGADPEGRTDLNRRADSDGSAPIGFTCQAFTSLSLDPPLISFAVSRQSSSRPRILAAGRFCVNILAFDQRGLCARFATPGIDRFASVDWWLSPGGSPVLDGSLAWIDCTVEAEYPGGDHTIVIGRVRELSHLRDAAPLVYHRGQFANCFPAAGPGPLPRVG